MAILTWDEDSKRLYEHGDKQLVIYKREERTAEESTVTKWIGYAWDGLTAFTESPEGAEESPFYADDIKYASLRSAEEYGCTIECYTYPDAFKGCIGEKAISGSEGAVTLHQQNHEQFRLSVVTTVGNDTDGDDYGYKYHFIYGCTAGVSERSHVTINDSPELETMSFEVKATKQNLVTTAGAVYTAANGFKPSAKITVDMSKLDNKTTKTIGEDESAKQYTLRTYVDEKIREKVYGTESTDAELPDVNDLVTIFRNAVSTFKGTNVVDDNGEESPEVGQ